MMIVLPKILSVLCVTIAEKAGWLTFADERLVREYLEQSQTDLSESPFVASAVRVSLLVGVVGVLAALLPILIESSLGFDVWPVDVGRIIGIAYIVWLQVLRRALFKTAKPPDNEKSKRRQAD
jgi:hypothetical protein